MRLLPLAVFALALSCGSSDEPGTAPSENPHGTLPPNGETPNDPLKPGEMPAEPAPLAPGFHVLAQYEDVGHGLAYANGFVYSVNYKEDTVWVFDAKSYATVKKIPVGKGPTRITVSDPWVFVVNAMASDTGDAFVSVIDSRSNVVTKSLGVSEKQEGTDPDNYPWTSFPWAAQPVGDRLYVTFPTNAEPDVLPIDIGTWTEHPLWAAGSGPGTLAGIDDRLVVVNGRNMLTGTDDALLVTSPSGALVKTLETSGRLHDTIVVGDRVVVARMPQDHSLGELVVVDPKALTFDTIATCAGPVGLATKDGLVYAACQFGRKVDVVDLATKTVTASIDLTKETKAVTNPRGIAVSPRGDIYLESDGLISVIVK